MCFFHQLQVLFRDALYTFVTQTIFMFGVSLTQLQHSALLNLISFTWDHFVSLCRSHWMASLLSVGVISLWTSSNPALIFFRINGLMVRSHCAFAFLSLSLFKYSGLSIAVHYQIVHLANQYCMLFLFLHSSHVSFYFYVSDQPFFSKYHLVLFLKSEATYILQSSSVIMTFLKSIEILNYKVCIMLRPLPKALFKLSIPESESTRLKRYTVFH